MNILFVVDILLSGRGGMETALSLIYHELKERHNVTVILKGESRDTTWQEGINTIALSAKINDFIPQHILFNMYSAALANVMKDLPRADIIVSTGAIGVKASTMAIERLNVQVPVVSWLHFNLDFYYQFFEDLRAADGHLAISEGNLRDLQCVFPEKHNRLVYNPVKFDNIPYVNRAVHPVFVVVGRLAKVKNVDQILRAFSPLQEKDFELHIIGDGDQYEVLEELSRQLGLQDHMVWHGWQQRPWDVVRNATSLVLASDTEPFGLVLIEALSRGIPVISSNCKYGPGEIVNASNGWLYEPEDLGQLTSILDRIMQGDLSLPAPEVCRESVRRYAVQSIAERFELALQDISKHRAIHRNESFTKYSKKQLTQQKNGSILEKNSNI
ncbi:glycosyltransferase [Paenibacillus silvae]|uniref:glycosyltransferase n=1 Tax=Paenibacillus TaxID=44249 RepID=UPI001C10DD1C|nr:glycosyltransferase [Paenibacillus barcinonensis]MBU5354674.1 glycosyltransferase [Paenibacillus barcinonensis]